MKSIILLSLFFAFACKRSDVLPPSPVLPVPTHHQLEWQEKELFAFVHFTVNTFTGKEWGYGDENPDI
ncbi:MAG: glycoside hydrolase family 29, partial [Bacteroidales bacterium]